jgi:myo-inositol 2-dehydrogenase/D-chiro-inositol 1-dehydrogenase
MSKITVGIVGAGRIGKLHAENILSYFPNVRLKSIADVYMDKSEEGAKSAGIENTYTDYRKIIDDPEIDAVLIFSSTNTHAEIAIAAAKAHKDIFCEKPIDPNPERIREVLKAVDEAGVKFQIGFNRRFDHNFRAVRDMVQAGKIGDPHIIKVTSRDPNPPSIDYVKVSGGLFMDMMIHDFDMVRYLSGSEVTEVFATGAVLVDPEIGKAGDIDTAIVSLKFANGAIGEIDNSRRAAYGYDQRVEVFGSKGCITVSNDTDSSAVLSTSEAVTSEKPKFFFLERYKDAYISELKEFFEAIEKNTQPPVVGIDGLKPVLIALAAKKSLEEGRPVKVEE